MISNLSFRFIDSAPLPVGRTCARAPLQELGRAAPGSTEAMPSLLSGSGGFGGPPRITQTGLGHAPSEVTSTASEATSAGSDVTSTASEVTSEASEITSTASHATSADSEATSAASDVTSEASEMSSEASHMASEPSDVTSEGA